MVSWDDVRRLALALSEAQEGTSWGTASWRAGYAEQRGLPG